MESARESGGCEMGPVGGWNNGECLIRQADIKAAVFSIGKERYLGICLDLMVPYGKCMVG